MLTSLIRMSEIRCGERFPTNMCYLTNYQFYIRYNPKKSLTSWAWTKMRQNANLRESRISAFSDRLKSQ